MPTPRAIVFDFDGVLADSETLHLRSYQDILSPHGIRLTQEEYCARYLGFDDEGAFRQIAADNGLLLGDEELEVLLQEKTRRFQALVSTEDVLYPGAAACVRRLGDDWPLAIASGALRHEIDLMLTRRRPAARLPLHRRRRRHREKQAGAGSLPARRGTARRPAGRVRRHRGLALGTDVGARPPGMTTIGITHTYPRASLREADTIVDSLDELTVEFVRPPDLRARRAPRLERPRFSAKPRPLLHRRMPLSLQARARTSPENCCARSTVRGRRWRPRRWRSRGVEYPGLDTEPYLQRLERMGEAAAARLHARGEDRVDARIATLNAYLFEELGFTGNREHYDDPRNSFLNEVLDRRTGIPISLSVVYLESRPARRPPARGREFSRALPGARPGGAGRRGSDRRSVPQPARCSPKSIAASCCASIWVTKPRSIRCCWRQRRASRSSCACW